MDNSTAEAYFKQVAIDFAPVSHTDAAPRFARFDLEELMGQLRQNLDTTHFCLLMETPTGKLEQNGGDAYFDNQALAYWLIRQVETNDFDGERDTLHLARKYGHQVLARCRQTLPGLEPLDLSTVEYDKVGPVFGNCYGYRFAFLQPDTTEIRLDADLWNG